MASLSTRLLELTFFLLFLKVAFIRGVHLSQSTVPTMEGEGIH